MPINFESQVAIFIDFENIEISYRLILGKDAEVDWSAVLGGFSMILKRCGFEKR